jgi:hypothetical protein
MFDSADVNELGQVRGVVICLHTSQTSCGGLGAFTIEHANCSGTVCQSGCIVAKNEQNNRFYNSTIDTNSSSGDWFC